jgi:hypothetical protein
MEMKMNSWWEDLDMSEELKKFHEHAVELMDLPHWAEIDCPFCNKKLSKRSIRSIQMLFNARNIGDIAMEFCCDDCKKMDVLYFRKAVKNTSEFAEFMNPDTNYDVILGHSQMYLENDMYDLKYNNLIEKMMEE